MDDDYGDSISKVDEFAAAQLRGEGILVGYVLIAEVLGEKGQEVRLVASDGMSPITALGMVTAAQGMIDLPYGFED